jgi:murein DD-endopeptidase MepM/ murein hydrolase activator NlpD
MSATHSAKSQAHPVFGKRREPHTIIIAHGDSVSHFTIKPWLTLSIGAVLSAMAIGYLLATTYLVMRDDLIGATVARQARIQQAYEDRIAALRAQVDRITSRQLLDQQMMETKVAELLERQDQLSSRSGRLGPLLERARDNITTGSIPLPADKPGSVLGSAASTPSQSLTARALGTRTVATEKSAADHADEIFASVTRSIKDIEARQIAEIRTLAGEARNSATQIQTALKSGGLAVAELEPVAEGGPYIPASEGAKITAFDKEVDRLDEALNALDTMKSQARRFPIISPIPNADITSRFGYRKDPIIGNAAFHGGIDFRAEIGQPVQAPAAGVVEFAGSKGGYGNCVEIRHKNGLLTRFGHLSRIRVNEGDKIAAGAVIGDVGNTGRSTGPHLHYEIRVDDNPVDPWRYLSIGRKIAALL